MSDKAYKTPLTDLLRSVPADTRLVIERSPFHHQTVPIGYLCDEAANEISLLRAELAARDAAAVDAIAQAYEDGRISACNAGKVGCPRVAALEAELARLRAFYQEVANLTIGHAVFHDMAVVYPSKLGAALERINPEWWKEPKS